MNLEFSLVCTVYHDRFIKHVDTAVKVLFENFSNFVLILRCDCVSNINCSFLL